MTCCGSGKRTEQNSWTFDHTPEADPCWAEFHCPSAIQHRGLLALQRTRVLRNACRVQRANGAAPTTLAPRQAQATRLPPPPPPHGDTLPDSDAITNAGQRQASTVLCGAAQCQFVTTDRVCVTHGRLYLIAADGQKPADTDKTAWRGRSPRARPVSYSPRPAACCRWGRQGAPGR